MKSLHERAGLPTSTRTWWHEMSFKGNFSAKFTQFAGNFRNSSEPARIRSWFSSRENRVLVYSNAFRVIPGMGLLIHWSYVRIIHPETFNLIQYLHMAYEPKIFAIKLAGILLLTPLMGYGLLRCAESFEKAWKLNNRRKRWLAMCGVFFLLAAIGGWLR